MKTENIIKRSKLTSTTKVDYADGIVYLRLLEGADFDLAALKEQMQAQQELVGADDYAVLVDATNHVSISKEARDHMSAYQNPKRKATALLTRHNLAMRIMANFYMSVHKPAIPTKMFHEEEEAVRWLKKHLDH